MQPFENYIQKWEYFRIVQTFSKTYYFIKNLLQKIKYGKIFFNFIILKNIILLFLLLYCLILEIFSVFRVALTKFLKTTSELILFFNFKENFGFLFVYNFFFFNFMEKIDKFSKIFPFC